MYGVNLQMLSCRKTESKVMRPLFCYGKETAEEIVIVIFGQNKVTP